MKVYFEDEYYYYSELVTMHNIAINVSGPRKTIQNIVQIVQKIMHQLEITAVRLDFFDRIQSTYNLF